MVKKQTAGRDQLGDFAPKFAALNDDVLFGEVWLREAGRNSETVKPIRESAGDVLSYDRTGINAWEDQEFYDAVQATGRKKILMAALWTEACLTLPTINALKEGFEVYPVVDCVRGTSLIAHDAALRRVEQAGAVPVSLAQLLCEFQRDWNRTETVPGFVQLMVEAGYFLNM